MSTERLIQTMRNVLRAKDREEEEFRRYNGFDWGYHGFQFTEASRDAAEEFGAALNEVVVEVVENITLSEGARGIFGERHGYFDDDKIWTAPPIHSRDCQGRRARCVRRC